jgi:hypothetical protein
MQEPVPQLITHFQIVEFVSTEGPGEFLLLAQPLSSTLLT